MTAFLHQNLTTPSGRPPLPTTELHDGLSTGISSLSPPTASSHPSASSFTSSIAPRDPTYVYHQVYQAHMAATHIPRPRTGPAICLIDRGMGPRFARDRELPRRDVVSSTVSQDCTDNRKVHVQRLCALGGTSPAPRRSLKRVLHASIESDDETLQLESKRPRTSVDRTGDIADGVRLRWCDGCNRSLSPLNWRNIIVMDCSHDVCGGCVKDLYGQLCCPVCQKLERLRLWKTQGETRAFFDANTHPIQWRTPSPQGLRYYDDFGNATPVQPAARERSFSPRYTSNGQYATAENSQTGAASLTSPPLDDERRRQKKQNVALHGLTGAGKTQIALEYVKQHGADYSQVFWISKEDDPESWRSLAEQLSSSGPAVSGFPRAQDRLPSNAGHPRHSVGDYSRFSRGLQSGFIHDHDTAPALSVVGKRLVGPGM